jgi:hypothetical protein
MSSLDYTIRIPQLTTALLTNATLINDNVVDQLFGDQLRDWFLRDPNDLVNDQAPDETITNVHL